ncbi:MAG: hypothetical protein AAGM46_25525 [Cyanobacteria bacterium J06582_2]
MQVADFLLYLRHVKKFSLPTIKGYRSVISNTVNADVGTNIDISNLIKSFALEIPVNSNSVVPWNLDIVLHYLRSDLFEPMGSISLKCLSMKTLFLMFMATAKRVSELQACSCDVGFAQGDVFVSYLPSFVAKTESHVNPLPRFFKILSLADLVGNEEDRYLCPVRALKFYLDRVRETRGQCKNLFVSIKQNDVPLSKNAMSFLIKKLIIEAHEWAHEDIIRTTRVKVHDVRAVSTSLARSLNVPLQTILESATWKTHSVFVAHYLKQLTLAYGDIYSLGPLVTAGAAVNV